MYYLTACDETRRLSLSHGKNGKITTGRGEKPKSCSSFSFFVNGKRGEKGGTFSILFDAEETAIYSSTEKVEGKNEGGNSSHTCGSGERRFFLIPTL